MVEACKSSLDYRRLSTSRRRFRVTRQKQVDKLSSSTEEIPKQNKGEEEKENNNEESSSSSSKKKQGTLEDMLVCFEFFFPIVYDNYELLEELAYDFVKRQYEQNVIYTEVRYSPHLLASDVQRVYKTITKGLRRGCAAFHFNDTHPIIVNQILCGINFSPDWSSEVLEMANMYRNDFPCAVVGIDVAAGEDHFDTSSPFYNGHYEMCQKAKELNINLTIHAGETAGINAGSNIISAIEKYGAKRIGHGYQMIHHYDVMEFVKSRNIHVEVCPTSSYETGSWKIDNSRTSSTKKWMNHPACIYQANGIENISLNSDDPGVFNTSLTWQYRIALKKMKWTKDDIVSTIRNSIDSSFTTDNEKERLHMIITNFLSNENNNNNQEPFYEDFSDRVHYD